MKVTLAKPLTIGEGESATKLEVIDMDLEALTGADILFCTREAEAAMGQRVTVIVMDQELHIQLAAKASGVSRASLLKLRAPDYVEVVTAVQAFLTSRL